MIYDNNVVYPIYANGNDQENTDNDNNSVVNPMHANNNDYTNTDNDNENNNVVKPMHANAKIHPENHLFFGLGFLPSPNGGLQHSVYTLI